MKKRINIVLGTALICSLLFSCGTESLNPIFATEKVVEESITGEEDVFTLLNGTYNRLSSGNYYGRNMIIFGEIRSDNCFVNGSTGRFISPASMHMGPSDGYSTGTWAAIYQVIASTNILIGLNPDDISGDEDHIRHYIGQAYALRAMAHFDLLRLFGQQHAGGDLGIPYMFFYKGEELYPSRNTVEEVKAFIYADIAEALLWMSTSLNNPSREYLSTFAVHALESRVATYFGDWDQVITASEAIINGVEYSVVPKADFVSSWYFDAAVNSIFELAFSSEDNNGVEGLESYFRVPKYGDIEVLEDLYQLFDSTDVRGSSDMIRLEDFSTQLRNMGKYPSGNFNNISIFRYEEVLLNYAEALHELGLGDPLIILNQLTAERGAEAYTTVSQDILLEERRKEFCFEGLRFDDLARAGRDIPEVDSLKQTHGGPLYGSYNYAFPIPRAEMNINPSMVQNRGYE